MSRNKKIRTALIVVAVLMVGLTVAYAATLLSSNLNISVNKVTQQAINWNVGFTGSSATAAAGGSSAEGRSCGTATITPTTVTVAATTLSKPQDSCTYTLNIANSGDINAKIKTITATNPTGTGVSCTGSGAQIVCGNITYTLATNSGGTTLLTTNTALNAGASTTVFLRAEFTGSTPSSSQVVQSGAAFSIVYEQN